MVLDPRRHATGQDTESGGDFSFRTAPAAADTGPVAAGQSQQWQLDAQLAQAAGNGTVTAQGQIARLPPMQQPRPAADEWWHAMHANFTATVKVRQSLVHQSWRPMLDIGNVIGKHMQCAGCGQRGGV